MWSGSPADLLRRLFPAIIAALLGCGTEEPPGSLQASAGRGNGPGRDGSHVTILLRDDFDRELVAVNAIRESLGPQGPVLRPSGHPRQEVLRPVPSSPPTASRHQT